MEQAHVHWGLGRLGEIVDDIVSLESMDSSSGFPLDLVARNDELRLLLPSVFLFFVRSMSVSQPKCMGF